MAASLVQEEPTAEAPQVTDETRQASSGFVGQWQTLVSTTNWEKGRIIAHWRRELETSGAPVTQYSDEAWAQMVGDVTGQHVGRLRRTHERFGEVYAEYEGLYWSHFQTALDWADAEMWLEGALQNGWSISQMRAKRWETVGQEAEPTDAAPAPTADAPAEAAELDHQQVEPEEAQVRDAGGGAERAASERDPHEPDADEASPAPAAERREPVRPMKDLAELPEDLAEAFEQFKLAILTHKMTGWDQISRDDVLASLAALKELALAPSGDE